MNSILGAAGIAVGTALAMLVLNDFSAEGFLSLIHILQTPKENMQALMDAARIFGRYPINKELLYAEEN